MRSNSNSGNHSLVLVANHDYVFPVETGKNKDLGYDYIFNKDQHKGVNILTMDEFNTRGAEEFGKYFEAAGELTIPDGSYRNSSLSYFTPKTVKAQEKSTIDQTNINSIKNSAIEYSYDRYAQIFSDIIVQDNVEVHYKAIVKAADILVAYIKAIDELNHQNPEFAHVKERLELKLDELKKDMPEVEYFMEMFLKACSATVDKLSQR